MIQEPPKVKILFENKWISLREMSSEKWAYTYSHEIRCGGYIVAILPFRRDPGTGRHQFMLRKETTPCWGPGQHISSITGGVEGGVGGKDAKETAVHEVLEEAGYRIEEKDLLPLGTCRGTKSTDTVYFLYAVDLTGKEQETAPGDGTELEKLAFCYWAGESEIKDAVDPMVFVMYHRLVTHTKLKFDWR
jgi:8-oxo-dGTP pyrophosphatase MutT (NUDIX family)